MHPGFDGSLANRWSVKRWTSIVDGEVRIFGSTGRTQLGSGDGLTLRFFLNGSQILPQAVSIPGANDLTQQLFDFDLVLASGDILDFVADDNSNPFFDNLLFSVQITQDIQIAPEPTSAVILIGVLLFARRRRAVSKT